MGEGRRRSRVREVIGRDIDRLHRSDGTVLGRCDTLLHLAHFRGQRRLVTHGGRHTAEQGRHLRTRLGETEDIVDEEEDVAGAFAGVAVAEGLRERQAAQGHAGTGSRGFVHLAEDHRHLGFLEFLLVHEGEVPLALFHRLVEGVAVADDVGFDHLAEEVVALAGTLAHAGEDGEAVMGLRDIVDEFLDQDGLAHAGAAEQADLAAREVGLQQVDDLDTREKDFLRGREVLELRRLAVDRKRLVAGEFPHTVDGVSHHVHHAAADLGAHRHRDGVARGAGRHAAAQAVGGIHRHAADRVLTDVLLHFDDERASVFPLDTQRFMNPRQVSASFQGEMNIHHRPHYLGDISCRTTSHRILF